MVRRTDENSIGVKLGVDPVSFLPRPEKNELISKVKGRILLLDGMWG